MRRIIRKISVVVIVITIIGGIIAGFKDLKQQKRSEHKPYGIYEKYFKRPLDFIFSAIALIILSPIMLVIAITVRVKLGKPIIFKQERPGRNEKEFILFKYRSMADAKDKDGKMLSDEERLTGFGKILRATSLDEIPELWNILIGQMSLVGPRPLLTEYLPYYSEQERKRHDVRPGLTGLAQVQGRNYLTWDERFFYDLKYVENISFIQDMGVILKSITVVMKRKGVADRTQIKSEEDGELYITINGMKRRYPKPLHIERRKPEEINTLEGKAE